MITKTHLFQGYGLLGVAGLCLLLAVRADAKKDKTKGPKIEVCHSAKANRQKIKIIKVSGKEAEKHAEKHGDHIITPEVCDGIDNDCDNVVDNGVDYDDGIACTVDDSCGGIMGCQNDPDDSLCSAGEICDVDNGCVVCPCADIYDEAIDVYTALGGNLANGWLVCPFGDGPAGVTTSDVTGSIATSINLFAIARDEEGGIPTGFCKAQVVGPPGVGVAYRQEIDGITDGEQTACVALQLSICQ